MEMSLEERRAFRAQHGYAPAVEAPWTPPKPKSGTSGKFGKFAARTTPSQRGFAGIALRGWKAPSHWNVPPPFENPGKALEQLGLEGFKTAVAEYWSKVGEERIERADEARTRWAVRQCLRMFETQVRGFRGQDVSRKGGIFGRSFGQEKFGEGRRAVYEDIIGTLPEDLAENGRIMYDLDVNLRAYGIVSEKKRRAAARLFRQRLEKTWGIKCPQPAELLSEPAQAGVGEVAVRAKA